MLYAELKSISRRGKRLLVFAFFFLTQFLRFSQAQETEANKFLRADKVSTIEIIHFGWRSRGSQSTKASPYDVQTLWFKDVENFKGPDAPVKWGYHKMHWPIRGKKRGPSKFFESAVNRSSLPKDPPPLVYLIKDEDGVYTPLDGRDGLYRYPGPNRLKKLSSWKKKPPTRPKWATQSSFTAESKTSSIKKNQAKNLAKVRRSQRR